MRLNLKLNRLMGKLCFILMYVLIGLQIYVISNVEEGYKLKNRTYLGYFKLVSYVFLFISTICHLRSSFTSPGLINHQNNVEYLDFYSMTRAMAVKRAEIFNISARHLIRPPSSNDDEEEVTSDCEFDDTEYDISPIFTEEKISQECKELGYELSKCNKCNICRMPGVHHCVTCQGCIYGMDHHCPWMNNCIGQFNQKYFIQYCFYSLIANLICGFITVYYIVIKQPLLYFFIIKIS